MADVEFRDGVREVPDYLARLMADINTHTMTYPEAVQAASNTIVRRRLNDAQQSVINEHFGRRS